MPENSSMTAESSAEERWSKAPVLRGDPLQDTAGSAGSTQPDLEVQVILKLINANHHPKRLQNYSVQAARSELRMAADMAGTREKVGHVVDRAIDGPDGPIRIRLYQPDGGGAPRPVLVWFHGGGFVLGCLDMSDGTCRAIANRSGAAVVSVDYRLAPEHDMSAGRRDCIAAVWWLKEHGASLGLDTARIAVGGDSAGGNLAAVAAQQCAKSGMALALQVLVYPATDLRIEYYDHPQADGLLLTHPVMEWLKDQIPDDLSADDAWLSPAVAESLDGVAPALVITAGCDPLHEDGLAYVRRLREDGVRVESLHYPGQIHGFMTFDLLLHAGRDALNRVGTSLAAAFAGHTGVTRAPAERFSGPRPQLSSVRRKLTELHFDQMVFSQFLLDMHCAWVGRLAAALGYRALLGQRPMESPPKIGLWPNRFRQAIGDIQ
jgi:acetyl esterase